MPKMWREYRVNYRAPNDAVLTILVLTHECEILPSGALVFRYDGVLHRAFAPGVWLDVCETEG